MTRASEPERKEGERPDAERAKTADVKDQAPSGPAGTDKPDEGIRPDRLTSETDGGSQG